MFFFFPYSTDAPIYHWPFATVGLIVVNVLVFVGMATGAISDPDAWILWYGAGLHPTQWITGMFSHGGIGHLVGNMLFLWVFGLVVEGKLGWWKFLACYLAIGLTQSVLEQFAMLGYSGDVSGSLGASAAIFGLMAMATVWAPMNEITFFWLFFVRTGTFDISILMMAAVYTGLETLFVVTSGGTAASSLLHLSGLALGLPLGIVLLKRGAVDCEGWDLFHVLRGDYGAFKKEPDLKQISSENAARRQHRDETLLTQAKAQLGTYLEGGNAAAALRLFEKMKHVGGGLRLERSELLALIRYLHAERQWAASAPLMADFLSRFPAGADVVRVKLAQICVAELNRPGRALELLRAIDMQGLPSQQRALASKIGAKARAMQSEGVVELDTDEW